MKKLFIAALALSVFAACNNDKKDKATDTTTTTTNTTNTTNNTTAGDGGWTAQYKETFMNQCVQGSTAQMGADKANSYCSCMYDKLKVRYPVADSLNNMNMTAMQEAMKDLAVDCLK